MKAIIGATQSFTHVMILSTGTPSALGRLVVYLDDGAGGIGALDFDSGQVSLSSSGTQDISFGGTKTYSGIIWVGYVPQSVSGSVSKFPGSLLGSDLFVSVASPYSVGAGIGYALTSITGAPPNPWGATYSDVTPSSCPVLYLKTL